MTEQEFDIQVRNLLQQATEEVSPHLWEGVAAGLEKKRRIVPVYVWRSIAVVAAAAAVIAGVVFLHPETVPTEHSNPTILAEAPVTEVAPTPVTETEPEVVSVRPAPSKPVRLAQTVVSQPAPEVTEVVTPVQEETPIADNPVPEEKVEPAVETVPEQPAKDSRTAFQEDQERMNRLLYEEDHKQSGGKGFSLSAQGNVQDKRRGSLGEFTRPYAAPIANATEGIYNEGTDSFTLPFSAGIGLKYNFSQHWGIGVGVRYTNLGRTFVGDYVGDGFRFLQTDIDNHQHWLGVPVHGYYEFVNRGPWRVHAFLGAGVEFLLDNDYLVHGVNNDIHYHGGHARPQWSGDMGVGVEFRITPFLGIYLDPSFRYYFATEWEPRSIRTVQPLRFDVELGLRFNLGK